MVLVNIIANRKLDESCMRVQLWCYPHSYSPQAKVGESLSFDSWSGSGTEGKRMPLQCPGKQWVQGKPVLHEGWIFFIFPSLLSSAPQLDKWDIYFLANNQFYFFLNALKNYSYKLVVSNDLLYTCIFTFQNSIMIGFQSDAYLIFCLLLM